MHGRRASAEKGVFEEVSGGNGYPGEQEKEWMEHLTSGLQEVGIKAKGWVKSAKKPGQW